MSNIRILNEKGTEELLIIGTALKNAKSIVDENEEHDSKELLIDQAISIIDSIVNDT